MDASERTAPIRRMIDAEFRPDERIGVILVQQESNSFAVAPSRLEQFTSMSGTDADRHLAGTNSEFAGACDEVRRRGAAAVPLLYAHAMPGGPLDDGEFTRLRAFVLDSVVSAGHLDGLIVCLHGALAVGAMSGDAAIMRAIRDQVGDQLPIAISLDLHANATAELLGFADVVTGYATNPHVDQAATGRRAAELLSATMSGELVPTMAIAKCPAIFPDQALRMDGILAEVLASTAPQAAESVVDVSVFPTQPWLDAPEVGFATVVVTNGDRPAADDLAGAITRAVWDRREEFAVERLMAPDAALHAALTATTRPFIITESADAPTAGSTGDGTAVLHALAGWTSPKTVFLTIVDPTAVDECHRHGVGSHVTLRVGASIDQRWSPPASFEGDVLQIGDGPYQLTGAGYTGMGVSMGRFATVRSGSVNLLITEQPAWSADPGAWQHGGLDPYDADVLVVRSCTDYIANFLASAPTAVVADTEGPATPRLSRLAYQHADPVPYPANLAASY